jgi:hypothetical protein
MENRPTRLHRTRTAITPASLPYDRARDLPRLMPLWPEDVDDVSLNARVALVGRLAALLRRERQRGLAGAWGYDLARHRQLLLAWRAERAALRLLAWNIAAAQPPINPRAACPTPSSSPAANAPRHSLARPSDNRGAIPISPDILPVTNCSESAGVASAI